MSPQSLIYQPTPPEPKNVSYVQKFSDTEPRSRPKRTYYRLNAAQKADRKVQKSIREKIRRLRIKQKRANTEART